MAIPLKQSTASQEIPLGYFVDDTLSSVFTPQFLYMRLANSIFLCQFFPRYFALAGNLLFCLYGYLAPRVMVSRRVSTGRRAVLGSLVIASIVLSEAGSTCLTNLWRALNARCHFGVEYLVGLPRHKFQILRAIVRLVPIDMMHDLIISERASQCLTHYKAMLQDIAIDTRIRMAFRGPDQQIPLGGHALASTPTTIQGTPATVPLEEDFLNPSCPQSPLRGPARHKLFATSTGAFHDHGGSFLNTLRLIVSRQKHGVVQWQYH